MAVNFFPSTRPPVPRLPISGIQENPLSKALRNCDNKDITEPQEIHEVYVVTNETGLAITHQFLKKLPKINKGCHVGFSGWHNFDIIVVRQSSLAVICDINPENAYFLYHVLSIVRNNKDRNSFLSEVLECMHTVNRGIEIRSKLTPGGERSVNSDVLFNSIGFSLNISADPIYEDALYLEDHIRIELKRKGSWLQKDKSYEYIRKLALNDKIALVTEDICNTSTFRKIKSLLQDNGFQIDSLYVSNIHGYMNTAGDEKDFLTTIDILSEPETIIIAAEHIVLTQKTSQAKTIPDKKDWFFGKTMSVAAIARDPSNAQGKYSGSYLKLTCNQPD